MFHSQDPDELKIPVEDNIKHVVICGHQVIPSDLLSPK